MANFDFEYTVDAENTENQGGDFSIMPEMYARLEVSAFDLRDTKDQKGKEAVLVFDVIEPQEYKGRKIWAYWVIAHQDGQANGQYFKFGKPNFDRLCRAADIAVPGNTDDFLFKSFTAKVVVKLGGANPAGGKYKDKNEIGKFFYDDEPDKLPEIGVIGAVAANDNAPAPRAAAPAPKPAAAPGAKPWAKKAA